MRSCRHFGCRRFQQVQQHNCLSDNDDVDGDVILMMMLMNMMMLLMLYSDHKAGETNDDDVYDVDSADLKARGFERFHSFHSKNLRKNVFQHFH